MLFLETSMERATGSNSVNGFAQTSGGGPRQFRGLRDNCLFARRSVRKQAMRIGTEPAPSASTAAHEAPSHADAPALSVTF